MKRDKILSYIGLAMKSGNLVSGTYATEKAIKEMKAYLIIIADDVSDNTRERYINMCEYFNAPLIFYSSKEELGHAIGKEYRASMAITDQGLAKAIIQNINQEVTDIWQR